ncbi:hypothetical protein S83_018656, partial [Arachis hypogaea]
RGFGNLQQLYVIFSVKHTLLPPQRRIAHLSSKISYYIVSRKQQVLSEAVFFVQWGHPF